MTIKKQENLANAYAKSSFLLAITPLAIFLGVVLLSLIAPVNGIGPYQINEFEWQSHAPIPTIWLPIYLTALVLMFAGPIMGVIAILRGRKGLKSEKADLARAGIILGALNLLLVFSGSTIHHIAGARGMVFF